MKFAPVMPAKWMPDLDDGDYHLVNSFSIDLEDIKTIQWLRHVKEMGHWVILDNGAYELGGAEQDRYFEVAEMICPSEIVCPDVPENPEATLVLMEDWWERCMRFYNESKCLSIMVVPQGHSPREWLDCYDRMVEFCESETNYLPTIGVPKYLEVWGRVGIVAYLTRQHRQSALTDLYKIPWSIHLLGIYSSFQEATLVASMFPEVRGIDSSWPVAYGLSEGDFGLMPLLGGFKYGISDWNRDYGDQCGNLIRANIATCRRLIQWSQMQRMPIL